MKTVLNLFQLASEDGSFGCQLYDPIELDREINKDSRSEIEEAVKEYFGIDLEIKSMTDTPDLIHLIRRGKSPAEGVFTLGLNYI